MFFAASYITLCHRKDPNLGTCFQKAVEQIRPHMKDGIPELFIPPMSPLVLPQAGLDNGDNFKASFRNIEVYYVDEFRVDNLNVDLDNVNFDVAISFPRLRIKSQYNIDGKILILQLKGQGPADGNFSELIIIVLFMFSVELNAQFYVSLNVFSIFQPMFPAN
jgi:hypothetical protein